MGLDNGIDYIKSSLPVSIFNYNYNIETTYASVVNNDYLYVGTNQGLVVKKLTEISDISELSFDMIPNTEGQVWNLSVIDGTLFCGHTNGAFIIRETSAEQIYDGLGVWNFVKPSVDENTILSGTYDGIIKFRKTANGKWQFNGKVEGINFSARDLTEDRIGNFWISHGYKGVYKVAMNSGFNEATTVKLYNDEHRLPAELPYFVHQINEQLFFSTRNGIYQYNMVQDNFLRPKNLNDFYDGLDLIYKLHQDQEGNIWYFTDTAAGIYKLLEDGTFVSISTPFKPLQNSLMASFSNLNVHDRNNIFIGTQDGLVHYNPNIEKNYKYDISAIIKQVYISDNQADSLWFENGSAQAKTNIPPSAFTLPFQYNNIRFQFSSNDMENSGTSEFKIRLLGFSDTWSDWNQSNDKEYTKLREGTYRFEVVTRNIYGNESNISGFNFTVKPPYYRSVLAYIFYAFVLLFTSVFSIIYVTRRIEKARRHEKIKQQTKYQEKTQKLREENIIAEQELVRLRNEQLITNMKHKNKELANATYHIIQKNKVLNKLKNDLAGLSRKAKSELVEEELQKISHKIDRDINHEQNWKVFNKYFDDVHQEFMTKLKEKHPELTPKDLRLCGYLRMNISTKEIAPLLNISIRGVEISRYRLRKKLLLERDDNLIEYLINF
jgi:ligand-binding sensor domain-containing protein/DNA-binding CsgD family transcriptional regulator